MPSFLRFPVSRSGRYFTASRFGRFNYSLSDIKNFKSFRKKGSYKRFLKSIKRF